MKKWARIILLPAALLVLAWAALMDFYSPELDIVGCPSDNLYTAASLIQDYVRRHPGELPAGPAQLRGSLFRRTGQDMELPSLVCMRARQPLRWGPSGLRDEAGGAVVVMCPPKSHGFIRRYAWAVVVDGSDVYFAVVRGDRVNRIRGPLFPP